MEQVAHYGIVTMEVQALGAIEHIEGYLFYLLMIQYSISNILAWNVLRVDSMTFSRILFWNIGLLHQRRGVNELH